MSVPRKMAPSLLKELHDQLQQHIKDLVPEDFNYDDLLMTDDVAVMEGLMTEEEIMQEIHEESRFMKNLLLFHICRKWRSRSPHY